MMKNLKVIYMGTPSFSADLLRSLISEGYNIVAVITQADALLGRKKILTPSPVKAVALAYDIPVFTPHRIRNDYEFIYDFAPDVILTFAYGQIVPQAVLDAPRFGAFNFHGSILPKYRGASPIQMALFNQDPTTGVSLMEMIDKMDAGRVYGIKEFPLSAIDNFETVAAKMVTASLWLMKHTFPAVIAGDNKGVKQDEAQVTFAPLLKRSDEFIDFTNDTLARVLGKLQAFTPGPAVSVYYHHELLKLHDFEKLNSDVTRPVGELSVHNGYLILQLKDGQIRIKTLQKAGKNIIDVRSFLNGEQVNLPTIVRGLERDE